MKCPKHPRYQAKSRPRTPCEPCWRKYLSGSPTVERSRVLGLIELLSERALLQAKHGSDEGGPLAMVDILETLTVSVLNGETAEQLEARAPRPRP